MKILALGLERSTLEDLAACHIDVEEPHSLTTHEELADWVRSGFYEALVLVLDRSGWDTFTPRSLRIHGLSIPVVGIADPAYRPPWAERHAAFLEQGGDYLLQPPPDAREIRAALRAATRRAVGMTHDIVTAVSGNATLVIDLTLLTFELNGVRVRLTERERGIMLALACRGGRPQTRGQLHAALYSGAVDEPESNIIEVLISKIRRKFEQIDPDGRSLIQAPGKGLGYLLPVVRSGLRQLLAA